MWSGVVWQYDCDWQCTAGSEPSDIITKRSVVFSPSNVELGDWACAGVDQNALYS